MAKNSIGQKIASFTKEVVDYMKRDYYNPAMQNMFVMRYNDTSTCDWRYNPRHEELRIVVFNRKKGEILDCTKYRYQNYSALNSVGNWMDGTFTEEYDYDSSKWAMIKDDISINQNSERAFQAGYDFSGVIDFNTVVRRMIGPKYLKSYYTSDELIKLQSMLDKALWSEPVTSASQSVMVKKYKN